MNQLSNIVVDFARYRRADGAARGLTAPDMGGRRAGLLSCRWRRDPATGRLICAWAAEKGAAKRSLPRDARSPPEGPQT
jgi:hypothetical protein